MNGLEPETVVMVWTLAVLAGGVIGGFLAATLWVLAGDLVVAAWAGLVAFLKRSAREIGAGFLNGVEWLVYGRSAPDVSRLFG